MGPAPTGFRSPWPRQKESQTRLCAPYQAAFLTALPMNSPGVRSPRHIAQTFPLQFFLLPGTVPSYMEFWCQGSDGELNPCSHE